MKHLTERELNKNFLLKDGDYKTTRDVFLRIAQIIPDKPILAELNEKKDIVYYTAKEIELLVSTIGAGLIIKGFKNKHIAISGENSVMYVIADSAISTGVGVVTPIDKEATDELFATLLNKCEAEVLITDSKLIERAEKAKKDVPLLKTIITMDQKVDGYLFLKEIAQVGNNEEALNHYRKDPIDLNTPVKILFTSGTTGANKGVVLTEKNLTANIINCMDTVIGQDGASLSVLPMHHATEINTHIMTRIASGRLTYINGPLKDMMANMRLFKPEVITIVPMIANAFYHTIWNSAKKLGKDKKLKKGIKLSNFLRIIGIDITHKLFKDIYTPFGGNLDEIVCGGAALDPKTVKGLSELGILTINGYGITECGPLVSMNTDTLHEPYSIGKPAPKLFARIENPDENGIGELSVRGESVSKGYYKDEEATKKVFLNDGTFLTGDYACIDSKGRIFLAGRKKNLIVLSNGKNVFPETIENEILVNLPYVKEAVVYEAMVKTLAGEEMTICAGVYLDPEQEHPQSEVLINDFRALNKKLETYEAIRYIDINDKEYLKNSTKKILRSEALKIHSLDKGISI